jgi:hypothetical protein
MRIWYSLPPICCSPCDLPKLPQGTIPSSHRTHSNSHLTPAMLLSYLLGGGLLAARVGDAVADAVPDVEVDDVPVVDFPATVACTT